MCLGIIQFFIKKIDRAKGADKEKRDGGSTLPAITTMCPQYIRKVLGAITTMCRYNVARSWIWGRTWCHVADEDLGGTLCRFLSTNPARRAATEGTLRSEPGFQAAEFAEG